MLLLYGYYTSLINFIFYRHYDILLAHLSDPTIFFFRVHLVRLLLHWYNNLYCSIVLLSMVSDPFAARWHLIFVFLCCLRRRSPWTAEMSQLSQVRWITISWIYFYADDIVLLSSSCCGLQNLLNICGKSGCQRDL